MKLNPNYKFGDVTVPNGKKSVVTRRSAPSESACLRGN